MFDIYVDNNPYLTTYDRDIARELINILSLAHEDVWMVIRREM